MSHGRRALAAVGLILFVVWEITTCHPVVNLRNLKHRGLAAGSVYVFVIGGIMFCYIMILCVYLQQIRQYTALQSGFMILPFAIASAVAMPITGALIGRVSPRLLTAVGSAVCFIGMWKIHDVTLLTGPEHLMGPQILTGAGFGVLFVVLMTASLIGLKGRDLAEGAGLFNLMRQLGGSVGIASIVSVLHRSTVFNHARVAEHVTLYDPEAVARLVAYRQFFMSQGNSDTVATQQALKAMDATILGQSSVLAFEHVFLIMALLFLITIPLSLLFGKAMPSDERIVVHFE